MRRVALVLLFNAIALAAESFQFSVSRVRTLRRDEPGRLEISASGASYQSEDAKSKLQIAMEDIREADVSDRRVIRLETYDRLKRKAGERREYTFRLREGMYGDDLARFLSERLNRPVAGSYATPEPAAFTIPAYHRHVLGGVHGKLEFGSEAIRFITEKPADSRTWPYRDIQTVGSSDPFHWRVSTYRETYMFDLQERLTPEAYDFAWQRVYGPARAR
jgi:hypothetical protein